MLWAMLVQIISCQHALETNPAFLCTSKAIGVTISFWISLPNWDFNLVIF